MTTNRVHRDGGLLRLGTFAVVVAVTALVSALAAGSGSAGTAKSCNVPPATAQPFLQWNDQDSYFLAPDGSFERKPDGWHFTGRVQIVKGNETYYVNNPSDTRSLWFGPNSYAQSPGICVSIHSPTIRLFAMNSGDPTSRLQVTLNYVDQKGKAKTAQIGSITGSSNWAPTDPMLFLNGIAPLVGGQGQTSVSFTFHVLGAGKWQIDDFYVDPLKSQ